MPGLGAGPDPFANSSGTAKLPGTTSVGCLFSWFGTKGNYASIAERDRALTGWRRHVTSVTKEGRVNFVVGTYIAVGILGVYLWKRYKTSAEAST